MLNAGSERVLVPSLTVIVMPSCEPTWSAGGVPQSRPVFLLNQVHRGLLLIENVNVSPSASTVRGLNVYSWSTTAAVEGAPLICGALPEAWLNEVVSASTMPSPRAQFFRVMPTRVLPRPFI